MELYAYVNDDPISNVDPLGLFDLNYSAGFHLPLAPGRYLSLREKPEKLG